MNVILDFLQEVKNKLSSCSLEIYLKYFSIHSGSNKVLEIILYKS